VDVGSVGPNVGYRQCGLGWMQCETRRGAGRRSRRAQRDRESVSAARVARWSARAAPLGFGR